MLLALFQNCNEESRNIPITGLTSEIQILIFGVLFPLLISIITAIIFARFIAPLFLTAKNNLLARKYSNGYLERDNSPFRAKRLVRRMFYLILLAFGFLSFIIPAVDANQWLSPETICNYEERGLDPQYNFTIFLALMGMVYPLAVGLWAVSWAIEDASLMHYVFRKDDYYEIEPIHVKYTSYLKGYAGISGLLFVIQFTMYQAENNSFEDGLIIIAALLIAIICFFPTYVIFTKILGDHSYLKKGVPEIKKLKEEDLN